MRHWITIQGSADLLSSNIKSGATIFGISGDPNVVDTSSGTLTAGSVLSGIVGFSGGAEITGTMPNIGTATENLSTVSNILTDPGANSYTTTQTLFTGSLTTGDAWALASGGFTYGASGATSTALGSIITSGDSLWKPLVGSDGSTSLPLTAEATFTVPSTVTTGDMGSLYLYQDVNNQYYAEMGGGNFYLAKNVNNTASPFSGYVAFTPAASTAYTITISLDHSGNLTAKLYDGSGTGGTLLETITASDTSLTGGYLIAVGGDSGVVVSNASMSGAFPNHYSIGNDAGESAWGITTDANQSGTNSLSAITYSTSASWASLPEIVVTPSAEYTASVYVKILSGTPTVGLRPIEFTSTGSVAKDNGLQATVTTTGGAWQRISWTWTTQSTTYQVGLRVQSNGAGDAEFNAMQLELGLAPTAFSVTGENPDMVSLGDSTVTNVTAMLATVIPPKGYYDGQNSWAQLLISGINSSLIADGTVIGWPGNTLTGTYTSDATATASDILNGATAYAGGQKITGNIPDYGAQTLQPGQAITTAAYYTSVTAAAPTSGSQTLSGSGTWDPPSGVTRVWVELIGGGGGGGGSAQDTTNSDGEGGGGGGGAAYTFGILDVSPGTGVSYAVGAGGSAGTGVVASSGTPIGSAGGNGGNTTFGGLTAYGGNGGGGGDLASGTNGAAGTGPSIDYTNAILGNTSSGGQAGWSGGVSTGGTVNGATGGGSGGSGGPGVSGSSGGAGGASLPSGALSGGGAGGTLTGGSTATITPPGFGGGGYGGGTNSYANGQAGGNGTIIVHW